MSSLNPSSSLLHLQSCGLHVCVRVVILSTELYLFTTVDVKLLFLSWWCSVDTVGPSDRLCRRQRAKTDDPSRAFFFFF